MSYVVVEVSEMHFDMLEFMMCVCVCVCVYVCLFVFFFFFFLMEIMG